VVRQTLTVGRNRGQIYALSKILDSNHLGFTISYSGLKKGRVLVILQQNVA